MSDAEIVDTPVLGEFGQCSCSGCSHNPFTCDGTSDLCRTPAVPGQMICGYPKGHEGPCRWSGDERSDA